MTDNTLRKSIILSAPPATVWEYLTEPDKMAIWFHAPKSTLTQGAPLALYGGDSGDKLCWGDVRVARPPEYLEYTFTIAPMGDTVSVVKWTLDAVESGTCLSLEHEGLPEGSEAFGLLMALDKGWDGHLGKMRTDIAA